MMDLISRQAAIKAIDDLPNCYNGYSDTYDKACIIGVLEELPSVEPKPGKWIKRKDAMGKDIYICSNCETGVLWRDMRGVLFRVDMQNANFCPNCGADMRERSEE